MAEEQDNTNAKAFGAELRADPNFPPEIRDDPETCSNCKQQLQLRCQLLPSGRNTVKADGHCSRYK